MKKQAITFLEYCILALLLGAFIYAFQGDRKQDIFIEDRSYYQKEIGEMQSKLDKIQANTKRIAKQLEIDYIIIEKYDFIENLDYFIAVPEIGDGVKVRSDGQLIDAKTGKVIPKDYVISIDMAKELAMVENNEMGKKVRKEKPLPKIIKKPKKRLA